MFECVNLRFVFKHERTGFFEVTNEDGKAKTHWSGRYNVLCEVYRDLTSFPLYTGLAKLHPNDEPDPIIGKKIALEAAMKGPFFVHIQGEYQTRFANKGVRTEIWSAFWSWIASWQPSCNICGSYDLRDGICVDCLVIAERECRIRHNLL